MRLVNKWWPNYTNDKIREKHFSYFVQTLSALEEQINLNIALFNYCLPWVSTLVPPLTFLPVQEKFLLNENFVHWERGPRNLPEIAGVQLKLTPTVSLQKK